MSAPSSVVGLVPAAGRARRLGLAGGSKELVAVPDLAAAAGRSPRVAVCHYLLRQYRAAGIDDVRLLRRAAKEDLGEYFAAGTVEGLAVEDVVVEPTPSAVHTIALGCAAAADAVIAVGFPDMVLEPRTLCRDALAALERDGTDLCIATVPIVAEERRNWDLLRVEGGRVVDYLMKPDETELEDGATLFVWRPGASRLLLDWLDDPHGAGGVEEELAIGHFARAALAAGLALSAVHAPEGFTMDIGVPERLARAARLRGGGAC